MEITGVLRDKFDTKNITEKFRMREFILNHTDAKQPQDIILQLQHDNCSSLDEIAIGTALQVSVEIRGRVWEHKYYNTLVATRIRVL